MSTAQDLQALNERREHIARELAALGDVQSGSLAERYRRCGKPTCHCATDGGPGHGPSWSLTRRVDGKTVTRIIAPSEVPEVQARVAECRRLRRLVRELIEVSDRFWETRRAGGGAGARGGREKGGLATRVAAEVSSEAEGRLGRSRRSARPRLRHGALEMVQGDPIPPGGHAVARVGFPHRASIKTGRQKRVPYIRPNGAQSYIRVVPCTSAACCASAPRPLGGRLPAYRARSPAGDPVRDPDRRAAGGGAPGDVGRVRFRGGGMDGADGAMKRYRAHREPLSTDALEVLDEARGLSTAVSRFAGRGREARRDDGGGHPEKRRTSTRRATASGRDSRNGRATRRWTNCSRSLRWRMSRDRRRWRRTRATTCWISGDP